MRAFPEILSRCGPSNDLAAFLQRTRLPKRPLLQSSVGDDWETLSRTLNQACEAYYLSIPEERPGHDTMFHRIKRFFMIGMKQHRNS